MTHIAVVNDDTIFLEMMAAVLRDRGYETSIHREGHRAYEELKEIMPDLIILDIRMGSPETGWTLLELLTLDRHMHCIPTIVCSAALFDLRAHEPWLKQQGIAVLPKPFDIKSLYAAVDQALENHQPPA